MRARCLLPAAAVALAAFATLANAQTWLPTGKPLAPLNGASATLLQDGRVLVAGGTSLPAENPLRILYSAQAELYDPGTGLFTGTGSLNYPRSGQAGVLLPDGHVLIVGGSYEAYAGALFATPPPELYDPQTGLFTLLAAVNGSPLPETVDVRATTLKDGRVLVVGDQAAWLFDPATMTFSAAPPTLAGAPYTCQLLLPSGNVLVVGGLYGDAVSPDAPPQIFHPATGQWETLSSGPMRWDPGCAMLPDGNVLVAGGSTQQDGGWRSEIFDPATETFAAAPGQLYTEAGPAFSMPDGRVLLPLGDSSEIYDPKSGAFSQAGAGGGDGAFVQLADGSVLAVGTVGVNSQMTGFGQVFHEALVPPFSFSLPTSATSPDGFGSVPFTTHFSGNFAGPITFTCWMRLVSHCSISPNPASAGQDASINLQFATGIQPAIITATSGEYTYWGVTAIGGPDFVMKPAKPTVTIPYAGASYLTINVGSFSVPGMTLSCANLPKYAACSFQPNPVETGGIDNQGPLAVSLLITTTPPPAPPSRGAAAGVLPLILLLTLGSGFAIGRRWRPALLVPVLACALACGGSPYAPPPPPPPTPLPTASPAGTYPITVNADWSAPKFPSLHFSTSFTLVIEPPSSPTSSQLSGGNQ